MDTGTLVDVRARFDRSWSSGFTLEETIAESGRPIGYRVRRVSDSMVLPHTFTGDDVRPRELGFDEWTTTPRRRELETWT